MKCIDCKEIAEYQYKGNSYCERCYIKHEKVNKVGREALMRMLDKMDRASEAYNEFIESLTKK